MQKQLDQYEDVRKKRERYREKLRQTLGTIYKLYSTEPDKVKTMIDELKALARETKDETESLYARAVLTQLARHSGIGARHLVNKDYEKAISNYKLVLLVYPEEKSLLYNLACAYSLNGNKEKALECLAKSVENGFTDVNHIEKDPDLEPIRQTDKYKEIINKLKKQ